MDSVGYERTIAFVVAEAPPGPLEWVWLKSISYVCNVGGSTYFIYLGWFAIAFLLVRRQWRPALGLLAVQALLVLAIANSRFLALPGTSLLYPGRISAWGSPLAAVRARLRLEVAR